MKFKLSREEWIIVLLALGAYIVCLVNDFHTDDWIVLSFIRDGFSLSDLASMENVGRFRPLTNIIVWFRYLAFGDTAYLYYILNIVLHAVISVLFYRLLLKLEFPKRAALISALFFAVYFQHYEAVIWLYGTIRELAVLAYIFSIWHLHGYLKTKSKISFLFFVLFSFLGLFVVEDFVVAPLLFGLFVLLFGENSDRSRIVKRVVLIGLVELIIYFAIRSVIIDRPGITETYYYPGFHMIRMLFEYMGWFVIPSPTHPYFQGFADSLPSPVYYLWRGISYLAVGSFLPLSVWLFIKSPKQVRFFILFVFVVMLPIIPLNYKVGSRNIYIPSLGLAVMAGYTLNLFLSKSTIKERLRKMVLIAAACYMAVSVAAVTVTSSEYRKTQLLVSGIIDDLRDTGIDLNNSDCVLLDNLPGRTVVGPSMIYRLDFKRYLIASNDPVKGPIDIATAADSLYNLNKSFVVFVYRDGRMVEATKEYILRKGSP
ncbi:MAG: hypothetical protein V3W18_06870 [candidate division Zixibacteria bacterium]